MTKLSGKVAVVTGASKGIGAGIAKALAKQGASVVVNYNSGKDDADSVVAEITSAGGTAVAVQADVSKPEQAEGLIETAVEHYGRLDILVNNAGIYRFAGIEDVTEESFRTHFDLNVLGVLMTMKAATRHLPEGGSIVNISSTGVSLHLPTTAIYAGSKGAVNVLSGVVAGELAERKIRVNVVNSGYVPTEGNHTVGMVGSDMEADLIEDTPLGRAGEPGDIADAVVFLASDDARFITAEEINVSGGLF